MKNKVIVVIVLALIVIAGISFAVSKYVVNRTLQQKEDNRIAQEKEQKRLDDLEYECIKNVNQKLDQSIYDWCVKNYPNEVEVTKPNGKFYYCKSGIRKMDSNPEYEDDIKECDKINGKP